MQHLCRTLEGRVVSDACSGMSRLGKVLRVASN